MCVPSFHTGAIICSFFPWTYSTRRRRWTNEILSADLSRKTFDPSESQNPTQVVKQSRGVWKNAFLVLLETQSGVKCLILDTHLFWVTTYWSVGQLCVTSQYQVHTTIAGGMRKELFQRHVKEKRFTSHLFEEMDSPARSGSRRWWSSLMI